MVARPTIKDLADAAGVSVSTINRVIGDAEAVRKPTRDRVLHAAERIGFYGLGTIERSVRGQVEVHRLGILLLQESRAFYRDLDAALRRAAAATEDGRVELTIEHLTDLSPDHVSDRLTVIGETSDAVALVAAEHPNISDAIDRLIEGGVPVLGLVAPISAQGNVGYVGLDSWKVGRMAAWVFEKTCREPGEIGILVGNHRYRNQDLNESGFRSFFREHGPGFSLLEPRSTFETAAIAQEMTEELFAVHPDMAGLFVSGGGITGVIAALRDARKRSGFIAVGYEITEPIRSALIDGTLTMTIAHPMDRMARATIMGLIRAKNAGREGGAQRVILPFDLYTSENV